MLYAAAVGQYGIFHLLDYLILIGVTYYFLASPIDRPGWKKSRYIVLYAATGLTLLWASIEKWGYPDWTFPLLERDPSLLMGLDARTYMILAGFVEFNLTFVLLSSASLLSRALALGLMSVFVLAIAKFGMIDAIGHLLIIAILAVLVLHGPTEGRNFLVLERQIAVDRGVFHDRPLRARVRADLHRLLWPALPGVWALVVLTRSGIPCADMWGN